MTSHAAVVARGMGRPCVSGSPSGLQSSARNDLSKSFKLFFDEQNIKYDMRILKKYNINKIK